MLKTPKTLLYAGIIFAAHICSAPSWAIIMDGEHREKRQDWRLRFARTVLALVSWRRALSSSGVALQHISANASLENETAYFVLLYAAWHHNEHVLAPVAGGGTAAAVS